MHARSRGPQALPPDSFWQPLGIRGRHTRIVGAPLPVPAAILSMWRSWQACVSHDPVISQNGWACRKRHQLIVVTILDISSQRLRTGDGVPVSNRSLPQSWHGIEPPRGSLLLSTKANSLLRQLLYLGSFILSSGPPPGRVYYAGQSALRT